MCQRKAGPNSTIATRPAWMGALQALAATKDKGAFAF
jgi:hypothetical protein